MTMSDDRQEFDCDYCGETHTMTMTEIQIHLAEKFMAEMTGGGDD
jgi:hypothetical protein